MQKLLIATTNPAKLNELSDFLKDLPLKLVSLQDVDIFQKAPETGRTFQENAILKAKFYQKLSGLPALADDGGFEIDALGGAPGVESHRWIDISKEATDEELIAHTLQQMKNLPLSQRQAQLRLVLALALPNGEIFTTEAKIRGIVPPVSAQKHMTGFPFRSLLFIPRLKKFYNSFELTAEETERYNHRKMAIEKMLPIIREKLC